MNLFHSVLNQLHFVILIFPLDFFINFTHFLEDFAISLLYLLRHAHREVDVQKGLAVYQYLHVLVRFKLALNTRYTPWLDKRLKSLRVVVKISCVETKTDFQILEVVWRNNGFSFLLGRLVVYVLVYRH